MFGLRNWRIGSLFGIPLEINVTWLLVFALVATTLAFSYFPSSDVLPNRPTWLYILLGVITAALFFASVVAHEFSHSLVAKAQGARIARITLFIFGGVSEMEEEPSGPGREFVMAIAGPGMSILLSAVFWVAFAALQVLHGPDVVSKVLEYLAAINLLLGIFNLLPGFPMDGGRVLRSILWAITGNLLRATRWASRTGQTIGYLLVAAGILGVVVGRSLDLVWFVFLGWFLASLADSAYQQQVVKTQLSQVPVSAVMSSPVVSAPGDLDLETMVEKYFIGGHHSRYPIEQDGRLIGMLSLPQAKAVPRERWRSTKVADVAERDLERLVVPSQEPLDQILDRLVGAPGAVLAANDGELVGIVTRNDVVHALQRSRRP
ncbi:MAG TPA: site-2 protease family protein [Coriobacteriia bacterium]